MASRKPERSIKIMKEAFIEHTRSNGSTKIVKAESFERAQQKTVQWKLDENAIYVGTPHRFIRSQHGNCAVLIVEIISNTEIRIMVDGCSMVVHPRELRPLDCEG